MTHPAIWLAGYIPDLPTPFDENEKIDPAAFSELCEHQIAVGVSAGPPLVRKDGAVLRELMCRWRMRDREGAFLAISVRGHAYSDLPADIS